MNLHAEIHAGRQPLPWLVFLHGFSGDGREWQPVGAALADFPRLYLDLPGHGASATTSVDSFTGMDALLRSTLSRYNILNYWLVGYSLGGRIAMFHACQQPMGLQGLIIEGGHPGLADEQARAARLEADEAWCQRLRHQPLSEVFDAWYRQPVFAALTETERATLVALRSHNDGNALAHMLAATSLGRQPDLRAALRDAAFPVHYFFGEHDCKFRALASEAARHCYAIPAAGHNAHRENPTAVAALLARILPLEIKDRP